MRRDDRRAAGRTRLAEAATRHFLRRIEGDELTLVDDRGPVSYGGEGGLSAEIQVRDPRVYGRVLRTGSIGLGLTYAQGGWSSPDLTTALRVLYRQSSRLDRLRPSQVAAGFRARRAGHTPEQERANVAAHYDTSNEFFALWLDPTMAYSCALFEPPDCGLAAAQQRKLDLICDRLGLGPDDHLLDVGCGWGSLLFHAARTRGCQVTGLTTSAAQHEHVTREIATRRLEGQVSVLLEDVRDHRGHYDGVASIEMIEALSVRHHQDLFDAMAGLLTPEGRAVLQAIVIADSHFETAQVRPDFIRAVTFPGGALPSRRSIDEGMPRAGFVREERTEIGRHYPPTLVAWRDRLADVAPSLAALGFDDVARRRWEFYFAYCEAGFLEGHIGVVSDVYVAGR